MMINRRTILGIAVAAAVALFAWAGSPDAGAEREGQNRVLVITIDGLRPDYVTPEIMPNLYRMKTEGAYGARSAAVFPSFTRPNRTTIPTGVYPGRHGIIHNNLPHPEDGSPIHTGNRRRMLDFERAEGRPMITAVTLGEILDAEGDRLLAIGTGAWLQNHLGKGKGWWMPGEIYPEDPKEELLAAVGEWPSGGRGPERTRWTVDLYIHDSLSEDPAEVVLMWLGHTDFAGHTHGVGAPKTLEALADTDANIGRILEAHEERGLTGEMNIFVTSDHGFTTSTGGFSAGRLIAEAGLEEHVTSIRNMFYVESGEREHLERLVETFHRNENVGTVYTRPKEPGASEGTIAGTLSMETVQWHHDRNPDAVAVPAWSDERNEFGWPGSTTRGGGATHGTDSPWDLRIPLIAYGPDFKGGLHSEVPTGNVDLAPTILHLRGIEPQESMDGRVLRELLAGGPDPAAVEVREKVHRVSRVFDDGLRYESALRTKIVGDTVYLQGSRTTRETGQ